MVFINKFVFYMSNQEWGKSVDQKLAGRVAGALDAQNTAGVASNERKELLARVEADKLRDFLQKTKENDGLEVAQKHASDLMKRYLVGGQESLAHTLMQACEEIGISFKIDLTGDVAATAALESFFVHNLRRSDEVSPEVKKMVELVIKYVQGFDMKAAFLKGIQELNEKKYPSGKVMIYAKDQGII